MEYSQVPPGSQQDCHRSLSRNSWKGLCEYTIFRTCLRSLCSWETGLTLFKVVGAPAFFKSVWEAISQWFDSETRSKIFVLSPSESTTFLLSHIAASDLPKEYGGELEWKWQDQPNLDQSTRHLVDEVYQKTDRGEVFSKGPLIFQDGCIRLVGSLYGLPRRNAFCRLETPPH